MKMDWNSYVGSTLNITMNENYGVVYGARENDSPTFYEIVFKTGKLVAAYDEGLLIEAVREQKPYKVFVNFQSIKCVEIF
ncbi:MAG: hypothetical protein KF816_06935 [Melioribacteraceae bacterium]|jgi:hypothetical protein|nr:hypothetical protein [Melioribacteraceae bacterium]